MKPSRVSALSGLVLFLAACTMDAPIELQPAETGERQCPSLSGTWDLSAARGLARAFPGDDLPAWLADSVTAVRMTPSDSGRVVIDFLADSDAIVSAADAMRQADPARYAHWRKRVEAEAPDDTMPAEGPALSLRRTAGHGSCTDGWLSLGYDRQAADAQGRSLTGMALSRNQDGALLVRSHYSRTKDTGFNFFGQNVSFDLDAGTHIALLPRRADEHALVTRRLRDLPLGVDPAALSRWRAAAPDRLTRINADILASLPPNVISEQFEVENLDVTHAKTVPDHFVITIAATFPQTTRADPVLNALQTLPQVSGLELVRQEDAGDGRRRTAVRFEYRD